MKLFKFTVHTHASGYGKVNHGGIVRSQDRYVEAESKEEAQLEILRRLPDHEWRHGEAVLWQTFSGLQEVSEVVEL